MIILNQYYKVAKIRYGIYQFDRHLIILNFCLIVLIISLADSINGVVNHIAKGPQIRVEQEAKAWDKREQQHQRGDNRIKQGPSENRTGDKVGRGEQLLLLEVRVRVRHYCDAF